MSKLSHVIKTKWRPFLSGLGLLGLFVLGVVVSSHMRSGTFEPRNLPTLSGSSVSLPGEGLSWVNVWSVSCPPCMEEMPYLEALHQEYQRDPESTVQVVALSVPYDPPSAALDIKERMNLSLPIALDLEGRAIEALTDRLVVPSHFLIDRDGKVLASHQGALSKDFIRNEINRHL